jgi:hypothetical protein
MERIFLFAAVAVSVLVPAASQPLAAPLDRAPQQEAPASARPDEWTIMLNYERYLPEPSLQFQPMRHA